MKRLRELIAITHKHGVELAREIREKTMTKKALDRLNMRRRSELEMREWSELFPRTNGNGFHPHGFTMYDSTEVTTIPTDAVAVAGYVGGKYRTFPLLVKMFPHAFRLSIAVNADEDAECLDVENGDASPDESGPWARRQRKRGVHRPCVYADRSNMPAVKASLIRAGFLLKEIRLWVADPTGVPHIPAGYDACQYNWKALGRNLDASACRSTFLT